MKKVIVLFIAMLALTSCNKDGIKRGPMVIQEVNKESTTKKTLGPGETWEVPGKYKVTIHSVKRTDARYEKSEYNPEDLVIIKYTAESLEKETALFPKAVVDEKGIRGRKYKIVPPESGETFSYNFARPGEPSENVIPFGLENKSKEVTISFIELTENASKDGYDTVGVYFKCPVQD